MKVFIVTEGSYSDYHIEKVFIDKLKAEIYAELICGEVEEYNTSNEDLYKRHNTIQCFYRLVDKRFSTYKGSIVESKKLINSNKYNLYPTPDICITRVYNEFEENTIIDNCKKICEDYYAQINCLTKNEGWTDQMVKDWFDKVPKIQ